ncbi:MAG: hypothetical protein EXR48_06550 [Dehalococcoidia bacterium]|nr:hypothetical protein [Dehalococcoidia bacterium]
MNAVTTATLTCPRCGRSQHAELRTDACQFFYEWGHCHAVLRPKKGDCCVFCSYADTRCPMKQQEREESGG